MKYVVLFSAALLSLPAAAQVKITAQRDKAVIEIAGKPFTTFYMSGEAFNAKVTKPYLWPLLAPSGTAITRSWPMENVAEEKDEKKDHQHQRGLWFVHDNVNKLDFWNNEWSYFADAHRKNLGRVNFIKLDGVTSGKDKGTITATFEWADMEGTKSLLTEKRVMTFYGDADARVFDVDITLTALKEPVAVVFAMKTEGEWRLKTMLRRSLTAKILLAVGVTVATVIAIYTYFVFRIQSAWWHERTQAQNHIAASMVHEYLEGVMLSARHEEVQHFLEEIKNSQEIWRGRILRWDGKVIFSTDKQERNVAFISTPPDLFKENRVLHGTRTEGAQRLAVVMMPILQHDRCTKCHGNDPKAIGAIMLERSMMPAEASIAGNRNLLVVYGIVIFVLVGIVLWLLIVRFVTQPVSEVLGQMHRVKLGDLAAQTAGQREDEIGELEQGFNAMVRSLETAKHELHESHEKQIQQAGKLASIGELASGIAHEIRNPLAGIGAAVEVLSESLSGNGQYAEVVAEIRRQIARLNGTLCDLLDFARPREPEILPCSVNELVKPMLALIRPDAQKYGIQIVEEIPPDLPPVCVDTKLVHQAILNILLNATQAMSTGGTLTVRAELVGKVLQEGHEGIVRIRIGDTGPGIPPENLQKIFSPFFTTKHRGTGLGLSITRTIVEKHNGTLSVESEVGRGTTMILEFAVCKASVLAALVGGVPPGACEPGPLRPIKS